MEGDGAQGAGITSAQASSAEDIRVPAQVDVAFDILRWGNSIQTGRADGRYESSSDGRELNNKENSVYEAALEVLRLYLTGEMSFEGYGQDTPVEGSAAAECFFCEKTEEK